MLGRVVTPAFFWIIMNTIKNKQPKLKYIFSTVQVRSFICPECNERVTDIGIVTNKKVYHHDCFKEAFGIYSPPDMEILILNKFNKE